MNAMFNVNSVIMTEYHCSYVLIVLFIQSVQR